jgi:hypothetical protein
MKRAKTMWKWSSAVTTWKWDIYFWLGDREGPGPHCVLCCKTLANEWLKALNVHLLDVVLLTIRENCASCTWQVHCLFTSLIPFTDWKRKHTRTTRD